MTASDLWNRLKGDVRALVRGMIGQRTVGTVGDGAVWLEEVDDDGDVVQTVEAAVLRRGPIRPGDQVLVVPLGDGRVALGAVARPGDAAEDDSPIWYAGNPVAQNELFGHSAEIAENANQATAVGQGAYIRGPQGAAFGQAAVAGPQAAAIGQFAGAIGQRSIALGRGAYVTADDQARIRANLVDIYRSSGAGETVLVLRSPDGGARWIRATDGNGLTVNDVPISGGSAGHPVGSGPGLAIGVGSSTTHATGVALGDNAVATGENAVAIGDGSSAPQHYTVVRAVTMSVRNPIPGNTSYLQIDRGGSAGSSNPAFIFVTAGGRLYTTPDGGEHALSSDVSAHTGNTSNPHATTAAQVGASPTGHTHDERYYTEAEANSTFAYLSTLQSHTAILGGHGEVRRALAANQASASTGEVAITDMALTVVTGQVWQIDCYLPHTTSTTNGVRFGVGRPGSSSLRGHVSGTRASIASLGVETIDAPSGVTVGAHTAFVASGSLTGYVEIHALVRVGSNGTLVPTFRSQNAANTVTILADAYMVARRVA